MSVSFSSNSTAEAQPTPTGCLCCQDAPGWSHYDPPNLKSFANPSCFFCHGTGIELEVVTHTPTFANDNAKLILKAMRLPPDLIGELPISDFKRACIRAINSSKIETRTATRKMRYFDPGISAEDILDNVRTLLEFATKEQEAGATVICWD